MTLSLIIPLFAAIVTGMAVNYMADVLPLTRSFSKPVCLDCEARLNLKDYLLLRPCSNGHRRGIRALVVLIFIASSSLYIWFYPPEKIGYTIGLILITYFSLIFVIDLEHRLILHPTSVAGIVIGLVAGLIKRGITPTLLGGLGGLIIMLFLYFIGVLFARFRAKRLVASGQETDDEEALGAGDVILVTILGFIVGWPLIWFGLLAGILLGGVISICLLLWLVISGQYSKNALMMFIPYGPYFITSTFVIVFFPDFVSSLLSG
ncbi:MAG: prepilin peptidase [Anaerolineales bacterium]|nr:prepilin peptidase [Anaerolineales bacterium]